MEQSRQAITKFRSNRPTCTTQPHNMPTALKMSSTKGGKQQQMTTSHHPTIWKRSWQRISMFQPHQPPASRSRTLPAAPRRPPPSHSPGPAAQQQITDRPACPCDIHPAANRVVGNISELLSQSPACGPLRRCGHKGHVMHTLLNLQCSSEVHKQDARVS